MFSADDCAAKEGLLAAGLEDPCVWVVVGTTADVDDVGIGAAEGQGAGSDISGCLEVEGDA